MSKSLPTTTLKHVQAYIVTMLLENGVNPRVVQRLMGHSDIGMTLGTYSHVVQEVYNEIADVLGNIYSDTVAGTYMPRMTGETLQTLGFQGLAMGKSVILCVF